MPHQFDAGALLYHYAATQNILDFFDWKAIVLFVILLVLTNIRKLKLHPIVYIAASAVIGIALQF